MRNDLPEAPPHSVQGHQGWTVEEMLHALVHLVTDIQTRMTRLEMEATERRQGGV